METTLNAMQQEDTHSFSPHMASSLALRITIIYTLETDYPLYPVASEAD